MAQRRKWLRCPVCHVETQVPYANQTCGRYCGAILVKRRNGNAWHIENGAKAGAAFAKGQADRTVAYWQALCPGLSATAIKKIRWQGYSAGWRTGYAAGFSTAIGERTKRVRGVA